jgi:hypothetical protein
MSERMSSLFDSSTLTILGSDFTNDDIWILRLFNFRLAVFQLGWWVELARFRARRRYFGLVFLSLVNAWSLLLMSLGDLC